MASQIARQLGVSRPSISPVRVGQPGQREPAVGLLQPLLLRARPVRIQMGQDPLAQQPDGARIGRARVLQQRRPRPKRRARPGPEPGIASTVSATAAACSAPISPAAKASAVAGKHRLQAPHRSGSAGHRTAPPPGPAYAPPPGCSATARLIRSASPRNPSVPGTFREFNSANTATADTATGKAPPPAPPADASSSTSERGRQAARSHVRFYRAEQPKASSYRSESSY